MIDPMLSLAVSLQSNPGVYAFLLGSGVSRSAAIPTSWEIVKDLICQLAAAEKEDCKPDPEAWYRQKFGVDPTYTKLLESIGKSSTERNQILRKYFEPSEAERESGQKVPTKAHQAVARLVQMGFVRVILTTNFDRLMEQALDEAGVTPTVISTPDAVEGCLPLTHERCSVIKLHGDYRDIRARNTPVELATYDPRIDGLLNRVFDEYGLVVCGWSAAWDVALRSALERCKNRRFTCYWTTLGQPEEEARSIIALKSANLIKIAGADQFFEQLAEKVQALSDFDRPHPLTAKVAAAQVKRYIAEPRFRIPLSELVMGEIERLVEEIESERYPITRTPPHEGWIDAEIPKRIQAFEALSGVGLASFAAGCFWGDNEEVDLWGKGVERLANRPPSRSSPFYEDLWELRHYPAVLHLYSGGISALAGQRYRTLIALLTNPKFLDEGEGWPFLETLYKEKLKFDKFGKLPGLEHKTCSLSLRLADVLRAPLREYIPDDRAYEMLFDRFEYLQSLTLVDANRDCLPLPGRFMFLHKRYPQRSIVSQVHKEIDAAGEAWPLLKAGFFGGDVVRLLQVVARVESLIQSSQL